MDDGVRALQALSTVTWGPRTPYVIEQVWNGEDVFVVHPEWLEMLRALDMDSLMTEERYVQIREERWQRVQEQSRRLGRWKYWGAWRNEPFIR